MNALSPGVPEGIGHAIEQIEKDDTLVAAVIIGGERSSPVPAWQTGQSKINRQERQEKVGWIARDDTPPRYAAKELPLWPV